MTAHHSPRSSSLDIIATAFLAIIVLAFASPLAAQETTGSNEFEYHFSDYSKRTESHTIFASVTNTRSRIQSHGEFTQEFTFSPQYDSLYRQSPEQFQWSATIPDGAYFDPVRRFLFWKPKSDQVGDHLVMIRVRYGDVRDSAIVALRVEQKWQSSLIPGARYVGYVPHDVGQYGTFTGASVEYLLISWIARNDNRGPSHGRAYVRFDLMNSTNPDVKASFFYSAGLHLSLERNPRRLYGIPFFGMEVGGMYNPLWDNIFEFTPMAGIWLYADQTNTISISGGYLIPSQQFESLRGWRASVGGTFSLW